MDSIGVTLFAIVLLAVIAEVIWSAIKKKRAYNLKESLANLGIMIGNNVLKPVSLAWKYVIFSLIES